LKTFIKQSKWLKVKAENVNIGIELHFYCVYGGKRNKNAIQSIFQQE